MDIILKWLCVPEPSSPGADKEFYSSPSHYALCIWVIGETSVSNGTNDFQRKAAFFYRHIVVRVDNASAKPIACTE